eukprot:scaffold4586_cov133-Cylindrotheca_fusiformis.AAC.2
MHAKCEDTDLESYVIPNDIPDFVADAAKAHSGCWQPASAILRSARGIPIGVVFIIWGIVVGPDVPRIYSGSQSLGLHCTILIFDPTSTQPMRKALKKATDRVDNFFAKIVQLAVDQ